MHALRLAAPPFASSRRRLARFGSAAALVAMSSAFTFGGSAWSAGANLCYQVRATTAANGVVPKSASRVATPVSSQALVASFSFDEGAGRTVTDSSGNANQGAAADTTWVRAGRFGQALSFNGRSSLLTIPDSASLRLTSALTLEAWVKPTKVSSAWRDVIYQGKDAVWLEATSGDARRGPSAGGTFGGRDLHISEAASLAPNRWSYLAETYDGSQLRLYLNGKEVAARAATGAISSSSSPIEIGGDSVYGQFFAGKIDEVRVYRAALSAVQIQADMITPISGEGCLRTSVALALTPGQTTRYTFAASGAKSQAAVWSVDGLAGGSAAAGTITTGGLYTAGSAAGSHVVAAAAAGSSARATVNVTNYAGTFTIHNDNARDGANLHETVLTPANVNLATFGKLFSYPLDGLTFASPLYVENVRIPGKGVHNIVYVATEHDSVYGFDANGRGTAPLWHTSFIDADAGVTPVPAADTQETGDIPREIGITGTPVIDAATNTLYVVAATRHVAEGRKTYVQELHALDLRTGVEKFGGPVVITATVPSVGADTADIAFSPLHANQRPGLLLVDGVVYVAFADHGFVPPYHGWVLGYEAATLKQVMTYCTSPNDGSAGIWMSGGGITADESGSLYFSTGNGHFDASTGGSDYGDSLIKLRPDGTVSDYFTPHNQKTLFLDDVDLGSGGVLLLPDQPGAHRRLIVAGGKGGTVYLLNRDDLGHYNTTGDGQIVQSLPHVFPGGTYETGNYSSPVYFGGTLYWAPINSSVDAFRLRNGRLPAAPTSKSREIYRGDTKTFIARGGTISISAAGKRNGILWALQSNGDKAPGTLHAYDAADLGHELYNSDQAGSGDALDPWLKFTVPLVANGMVYVASAGRLTAFGLLH